MASSQNVYFYFFMLFCVLAPVLGGRVLILLYLIGIWKSSSGSFRHPSGKAWGRVKLYMYIHSVWKTCPYLISIARWSFFFFFLLFFLFFFFLSCIYPEPVNAVVLACVVMAFLFQVIFSTTHTHYTGICMSCAFDLRLKFQGVDLSQPIQLTDDLQPISTWVQMHLLGQVLCKHSHGQCFLLLLSENSGPMHSCLRPVQFEAQQNMIGGGGRWGWAGNDWLLGHITKENKQNNRRRVDEGSKMGDES